MMVTVLETDHGILSDSRALRRGRLADRRQGMKMKATVEQRLPQAGFVYVGETRMQFVPGYCVREAVLPSNAIVLREANWGAATTQEKAACRSALKKAYPDKQIIVA